MNSSCTFEQELIYESKVQVLFCICYVLIGVGGIAGNIIMIISTLRSVNLWVNTRLFLINMAVSDIIMCITAVPVTPYTAFKGSWSFGPTFCYVLPLLQGSAIYVSSLSLLGIAWDRYKALQVTYTSGQRLTLSTVFMIIAIDVTSVMMMVPYCCNMQFSVHGGIEICREDWSGSYRISFGVITVILQFFVPFVVSLYVYMYIINSLKDRTKAKLQFSIHLQRRKNIKATNRYRSLILLTMLMVFAICWFPLNLINLMEDLEVPLLCWPYYYITFFTFHLFAMFSTCCNPILYGYLARKSISSPTSEGRNIQQHSTLNSTVSLNPTIATTEF